MAQPGVAKVDVPSLAGTKRKRPSEKKYYAVKVGKEPGVYETWDQCLAQVTGQKGAQCELNQVYAARARDSHLIQSSLSPFLKTHDRTWQAP